MKERFLQVSFAKKVKGWRIYPAACVKRDKFFPIISQQVRMLGCLDRLMKGGGGGEQKRRRVEKE